MKRSVDKRKAVILNKRSSIMPDEINRSGSTWLRSLVNGVFAWFMGFVV